MTLKASEGNHIVNSTAVGSNDTQLTKFYDLLDLIIDGIIDIVIYFVNVKYILVVGSLRVFLKNTCIPAGSASAAKASSVLVTALSGFSGISLAIESSQEDSPSKTFSTL